MDITLDITRKFNTLVNYYCFFDGPPMNPVIFLKFPNKLDKDISFELMNFGLNLEFDMNKYFKQKSPYFDDILACDYPYSRIIIYGKAKFNITGIKGADIRFDDKYEPFTHEKFYHSWEYKVEKGDYNFECGGYSPFSDHFITIHLIASNTAKATVTFSSEEYFLIDSEKESLNKIASSKQTPYCFSNAEIIKMPFNNFNIEGKMFDINFKNKYFETVYSDYFYTSIAITDEK